MKRFLPLLLLLASTPAYSNVVHKLTSSTKLITDGAYSVSSRGPATYTVSGSNIKVSAANGSVFGGLTAPTSVTASSAMTEGTYDINTAGSAFSFSESFQQGDVVNPINTGSDVSSGIVADLAAFSTTTTYSGGVAGSLAGTTVANHTSTCSPGGSGTSCTNQFVSEIQLLD